MYKNIIVLLAVLLSACGAQPQTFNSIEVLEDYCDTNNVVNMEGQILSVVTCRDHEDGQECGPAGSWVELPYGVQIDKCGERLVRVTYVN